MTNWHNMIEKHKIQYFFLVDADFHSTDSFFIQFEDSVFDEQEKKSISSICMMSTCWYMVQKLNFDTKQMNERFNSVKISNQVYSPQYHENKRLFGTDLIWLFFSNFFLKI